MNERPEQPQLLDDVLRESSPPDFRAALLDETLRLARRRRHWRQSRRAGGIIGLLVFAAWLAGHDWAPKHSIVPQAGRQPQQNRAPAYRLVETMPLPSTREVTTRGFAGSGVIASYASVLPVASSGSGFRVINDAQLLALAGKKAAILIRTGPNSEELLFAEAMGPAKAGPGN